jgi:nucleotide-binding universal stress UspA family protein
MNPPVVCGIDWSRRSWAALRLADALTARSGSRLAVLHVAPLATESVQRERGELLHDGIRSVLGRDDVPVTIDAGDPLDRLLAAGRRAALLVVGSPRASSPSRALRGGVSGSLTRRAACPVLVAPWKGHGTSRPALAGRTILCAARDGRDLACAATAACWATDLDLGLTLAHAVDPPPMARGVAIAEPQPLGPPTPGERAAAALEALTLLVADVAALAPADVRTAVVFGSPARQLRRLAESEDASMIVVGPRSHGVLREALSRSPTARLIRRGSHPVMVCPGADAALQAERYGIQASALRS